MQRDPLQLVEMLTPTTEEVESILVTHQKLVNLLSKLDSQNRDISKVEPTGSTAKNTFVPGDKLDFDMTIFLNAFSPNATECHMVQFFPRTLARILKVLKQNLQGDDIIFPETNKFLELIDIQANGVASRSLPGLKLFGKKCAI